MTESHKTKEDFQEDGMALEGSILGWFQMCRNATPVNFSNKQNYALQPHPTHT